MAYSSSLINHRFKSPMAASTSSFIMYVILETEDNTSFTLKARNTDTVLEFKLRIYKSTGIPIFHQKLVFHGRVLDNTGDVQSLFIVPNSRIQLQIQDPFLNLRQPAVQVQLFIKIPNKSDFLSLPLVISDTVLQLKHNVRKKSPKMLINRMGVYMHCKKSELLEGKRLSDYGLINGSRLDIFIKPSQDPLPPQGPPKLHIRMLTPCGHWLYVKVDGDDYGRVLRDAVEKKKKKLKFELSSDYFFVYEFGILDENKSFLENGFNFGTELTIIQGTVHLLLQKLSTSGSAHIRTCRHSPLLVVD